jgi:hypothetical protein
MLKRLALIACVLAFAAPLAIAQTAPADSTGTPAMLAQNTAPPPTTTMPPSPPAWRPTRFGALSGSWLGPRGDFADLVADGWSITGEGYQFTNPMRKIAAGTELGYYDFAAKKGPLGVESKLWFVPVDIVLKFFPKSDGGRLSPFIQGGGGFNYVRSEVGGALHTDIEFGAQAGVGILLHGSGRTALKVDGIYHWIFGGGNGADPEFVSVRGGIVVPMMR